MSELLATVRRFEPGQKTAIRAQAPPGGYTNNIFGTDDPSANATAASEHQASKQRAQQQQQQQSDFRQPNYVQPPAAQPSVRRGERNSSQIVFGDDHSNNPEPAQAPRQATAPSAAAPVTGQRSSSRVSNPPGGRSNFTLG